MKSWVSGQKSLIKKMFYVKFYMDPGIIRFSIYDDFECPLFPALRQRSGTSPKFTLDLGHLTRLNFSLSSITFPDGRKCYISYLHALLGFWDTLPIALNFPAPDVIVPGTSDEEGSRGDRRRWKSETRNGIVGRISDLDIFHRIRLSTEAEARSCGSSESCRRTERALTKQRHGRQM